jgi:hypothetical protein
VEGLKDIYDHSQKAGVVIGLEPLNRFESNSGRTKVDPRKR